MTVRSRTEPPADQEQATRRGDRHRLLAGVLFALAAGVASLSLLGPLVLGWVQYHVVDDVENQVMGGDLVALAVVAPTCVVAGVLVLRRRPAGPVLALAPTAFVMYLDTQLAVGGEFAAVVGTSERAFPLMLALFWVAGAGFVLAWRAADVASLPEPGDALRRSVGSALLLVAVFLTFGLHLRGVVDVVGGPPYGVEYTQGPTVFWIVKWMDLGLVVPLSALTAVGVLRRAPWSRLLMYAVIGWAALLGTAVAAMGAVMVINDDPAASPGLVGGFVGFAVVFLALTGWLFRPLLDLTAPAQPGGQQHHRHADDAEDHLQRVEADPGQLHQLEQDQAEAGSQGQLPGPSHAREDRGGGRREPAADQQPQPHPRDPPVLERSSAQHRGVGGQQRTVGSSYQQGAASERGH